MFNSTESSPFSSRLQVGSPMSKAMTIVGMVVAGLVGLVFILDLAVGIPFDRANSMMDVGALIGAAILGYLSWDAMRDIR
jgi:hypothetical protein